MGVLSHGSPPNSNFFTAVGYKYVEFGIALIFNGNKRKNIYWTRALGASLHTNKQDHISTIRFKWIVEM